MPTLSGIYLSEETYDKLGDYGASIGITKTEKNKIAKAIILEKLMASGFIKQ